MTGLQWIRHAVRLVFCHALYYTGVLQWSQRRVLRGRAVVLMYHRVLVDAERSETGSHPGIVVDVETFARQMALLRRRFVVLDVEQFMRHIEGGIPFPDSSCLITFDDGWRDNLTNALPILERYQLPALVFLPVHFIGTGRLFWREALAQLLGTALHHVKQQPAKRGELERLLRAAGCEGLLQPGASPTRQDISMALDSLKMQDRSVVEGLQTSVARLLGLALETVSATDLFLDWAQVDAMAGRGISFGGHGADHLLLTQVAPAAAKNEIFVSKSRIDRMERGGAAAFSYPNGAWTPDVAAQVRAAGYRLAFTTEPGFVSTSSDPFGLPRVNVHDGVTRTGPMFLARLMGLA